MTKFGFTKSIVHLLRKNSLYNKTRFMKRNYLIKIIPVLAVIIALVITGLAWQTNPGKGSQAKTDTIPDRKKKIRDIDDAINELDKAKVEVDRELKNMDWPKINEDIRVSIKDIDVQKIKVEVANAIKNIDMVKIQADVQQAMKDIDVAKIQAQVNESLKDVAVEKI